MPSLAYYVQFIAHFNIPTNIKQCQKFYEIILLVLC